MLSAVENDRGKRVLRWDALYCALTGVFALGLSPPLASLFSVPAGLLTALGIATLVWACVLARLAVRRAAPRLVATVAAANLVATGALLALAWFAPGPAAKALLAAVAAEVAAIATLQLRAASRAD